MPYRSARVRLSQADTWLLELFLACYTLIWGLNIANPMTDAFINSPRSYALLSGFPGGETAFGAVAALCGALAVCAALVGSRPTRALAAAVVGAFWLCVSIAVGVPTNWAGGGVLVLVALADWFCWTRLRYRGDAA